MGAIQQILLGGGQLGLAPVAPTIGAATGGNTSASITFTNNFDNGSPITQNRMTSSPGGFTNTGTSPIVVSGLTNGTAYTFTATATNAVGISLSSSASNSVTPAAGAVVPAAPTIGTASIASGTSCSVTFTNNSNGGSAITVNTATASPGGLTGTGT